MKRPATAHPSATTALALMCLGFTPKPATCRSRRATLKQTDIEPGAAAAPDGLDRYEKCAARRERIARYIATDGPVSRLDVRLLTGASEYAITQDLRWLADKKRVRSYRMGQVWLYEVLA